MQFVVAILAVVVACIVGVLVGPQVKYFAGGVVAEARYAGTSVIAHLHALVNAGLLEKQHIVDYVEALTAREKAQALAVLTEARVSVTEVGTVVGAVLDKSIAEHAPGLPTPVATGEAAAAPAGRNA